MLVQPVSKGCKQWKQPTKSEQKLQFKVQQHTPEHFSFLPLPHFPSHGIEPRIPGAKRTTLRNAETTTQFFSAWGVVACQGAFVANTAVLEQSGSTEVIKRSTLAKFKDDRTKRDLCSGLSEVTLLPIPNEWSNQWFLQQKETESHEICTIFSTTTFGTPRYSAKHWVEILQWMNSNNSNIA